MKNLKFKTRQGEEIELDEFDMQNIYYHYEEQRTADYLRENHEDWSEEKVQEIASEACRQMHKYGYDEEEAIDIAIEKCR